MRRRCAVLLAAVTLLAACSKQEAKADPTADQATAERIGLVNRDFPPGWAVQSSNEISDALRSCLVPQSSAPSATNVSKRYALGLGLGASAFGDVEVWPSAAAANNALAVIGSDQFTYCARAAVERNLKDRSVTIVSRHGVPASAPARADGSVRSVTSFVVEFSGSQRVELYLDVLRVRRNRYTVSTVLFGPVDPFKDTTSRDLIDSMLNRVKG